MMMGCVTAASPAGCVDVIDAEDTWLAAEIDAVFAQVGDPQQVLPTLTCGVATVRRRVPGSCRTAARIAHLRPRHRVVRRGGRQRGPPTSI